MSSPVSAADPAALAPATDASGDRQIMTGTAIQHQLDLLGDRFEQLEFTMGQLLEQQSADDDPVADRLTRIETALGALGARDPAPAKLATALDTLSNRLAALEARLDAPADDAVQRLLDRFDRVEAAILDGGPELSAAVQDIAQTVTALAARPDPAADLAEQRKDLSRFLVALEGVTKRHAGLHDQTAARLAGFERKIAEGLEGFFGGDLDERLAGIERAVSGTPGVLEAVEAGLAALPDRVASAMPQETEARLGAMAEHVASLGAVMREVAERPALTRDPSADDDRMAMLGAAMERLTRQHEAEAERTGEVLARIADAATRAGDGAALATPLREAVADLREAVAAGNGSAAERMGAVASDLAEVKDAIAALAARPAPRLDLSEHRQGMARVMVALDAMAKRQDQALGRADSRLEAIETALASRDPIADPGETAERITASVEAALDRVSASAGADAAGLRDHLKSLETLIGTLASRPAPRVDLTEHRQSMARVLVALDAFSKRQAAGLEAMDARLGSLEDAWRDGAGQAPRTPEDVAGQLDRLGERMESLLAAPAEETRNRLERIEDRVTGLSEEAGRLMQRAAPRLDLTEQRQGLARFMTALKAFSQEQAALHAQTAARLSAFEAHLESRSAGADPDTGHDAARPIATLLDLCRGMHATLDALCDRIEPPADDVDASGGTDPAPAAPAKTLPHPAPDGPTVARALLTAVRDLRAALEGSHAGSGDAEAVRAAEHGLRCAVAEMVAGLYRDAALQRA